MMHNIIRTKNFELDPPSWDLVLACLTDGLFTLSEEQDSQWFHKVQLSNGTVETFFLHEFIILLSE